MLWLSERGKIFRLIKLILVYQVLSQLPLFLCAQERQNKKTQHFKIGIEALRLPYYQKAVITVDLKKLLFDGLVVVG